MLDRFTNVRITANSVNSLSELAMLSLGVNTVEVIVRFIMACSVYLLLFLYIDN